MEKGNKGGVGCGFWKEHSKAWSGSGLTQAAYCEKQGISYQSFVYQHNRNNKAPKKTMVKFIESKPAIGVALPQTAMIQLLLPNGIRISIGHEVSGALLQTVLTVAQGVSC